MSKIGSLFGNSKQAADEATDSSLKTITEKHSGESGKSEGVTSHAIQPDTTLPAEGVVLNKVGIDDLNTPELNTPVPFKSVSIEDQKTLAGNMAEELAGLDREQVDRVIDELRSAKMTAKEFNRFKTAVGLARDDIAHPGLCDCR